MNPFQNADKLFHDLLIKSSGVSCASEINSKDCLSAIEKVQNEYGVPAAVFSRWMSKLPTVSIQVKKVIENDDENILVRSGLRTSCVRLPNGGFLFMCNDECIVLDVIPVGWNSGKDLHDLVEMYRAEKAEGAVYA